MERRRVGDKKKPETLPLLLKKATVYIHPRRRERKERRPKRKREKTTNDTRKTFAEAFYEEKR